MSFESLFVGMSGLSTFQGALKVVSNNIANMNTAGFKGSQLRFTDLMPQRGSVSADGGQNLGNGVTMMPPLLDMSEGAVQRTGNALDVALSGEGFFMSRQDGVTHYSRSGQFQFDKDGFLVSRTSGFRIAGVADSGSITDISLEGYRNVAATATSEIKFRNNIPHSLDEHVLDTVNVIDHVGATHTLKMTFTKVVPTQPGDSITWNAKLTDGVTQVAAFTLHVGFSGAVSSPTETFVLRPTNGTQEVEFKLNFTSATSNASPGSQNISAESDGKGTGVLTGQSIDADGFLVFAFSNGDTKKGPRLAIASFDSTRSLQQVGGGDFISNDSQAPRLVQPGTSTGRTIKPGEVELSNVELSDAFGELIMAQRAYQSASRVVTTANQMMEDLLNAKGGR
jgi:flagellar hook protein FlgE